MKLNLKKANEKLSKGNSVYLPNGKTISIVNGKTWLYDSEKRIGTQIPKNGLKAILSAIE